MKDVSENILKIRYLKKAEQVKEKDEESQICQEITVKTCNVLGRSRLLSSIFSKAFSHLKNNLKNFFIKSFKQFRTQTNS